MLSRGLWEDIALPALKKVSLLCSSMHAFLILWNTFNNVKTKYHNKEFYNFVKYCLQKETSIVAKQEVVLKLCTCHNAASSSVLTCMSSMMSNSLCPAVQCRRPQLLHETWYS